VKVIAGRDKGKTGRVLDVDEKKGGFWWNTSMMVKRHTRQESGQADRRRHRGERAPIAVSNVMILCSKCGPVRISPPRGAELGRQSAAHAHLS
jgi:large subunit ribosomal protein L24